MDLECLKRTADLRLVALLLREWGEVHHLAVRHLCCIGLEKPRPLPKVMKNFAYFTLLFAIEEGFRKCSTY